MALALATAHLGDCEFLEAFHSCRLSASEFRHADHFRLAWLHLHRETLDTTLLRVRTGIQAFAARDFGAQHRVAHLYHETITMAWVRLLAPHRESSFDEFLAQNEPRLGLHLLHRLWTPEVLAGQEARTAWVPPGSARAA